MQIDISTTDKDRISTTINYPNSQEWEILSSVDDLALVHYKVSHTRSMVAKPSLPELRGWIVDNSKNVVLAKSFGYTPTATVDSLELKDGNLQIIDDEGCTHDFKEGKFAIKVGYEGAIIRILRHGGNTYTSSHRRLDISRSHWGNSRTFKEMLISIGIPTLFDDDKNYSPYCHMFLMVHPELLNASLEKPSGGYLVYLGDYCAYTQENCPYPIEEVDWTNKAPEERRTHPISLDDANIMLRDGWSVEERPTGDSRLGGGEFVMVYSTEGSQPTKLVKVQSSAYTWRSFLRDNNPNLSHRFFQLAEYSYNKNMDYDKTFPKLTQKRLSELRKIIGNIVPSPNMEMKDAFKKLTNIWTCYWLAVPIHLRPKILEVQQEYRKSRADISTWLFKLEMSTNVGELDIPDRAKNIVSLARARAIQQHSDSQYISGGGSVDQRTKSNINNLIRKEHGTSLYRLVKAHKEYQLEYHQ